MPSRHGVDMARTIASGRVSIAVCDDAATAALAAMLSDPQVYEPFFACSRWSGIEGRLEVWSGQAGTGTGCDKVLFAVRERQSGDLIGCIQLVVDHLSYFVAPAYWRQGYGSEMVAAFIGQQAGLQQRESIYTTVVRENTASRRILEQCGFTFDGVFMTRAAVHAPARTLLEYVYRIARDCPAQGIATLAASN
jgi:ribosomal-protein-alanine N-acetyltransferase